MYDDILQTSILISTRGKAGIGDFDIMQDGIKKIKAFIHSSNYHIEHAIVDSAKAAYISVCIRKGITSIKKYPGNPETVLDMSLSPVLTNKLNKLKKINPEAYYYWVKIGEMLEGG